MDSCLLSIKAGRRKLGTITQRSSNAPLKEQVTHLWESFRRLRQRTAWKKAVAGCIAVLEITYNHERLQWHPHLHLVLDATYIPQAVLSKEWCHSSRGSKVVDIRAIRDSTKTATYLTSYLTKPPDFKETNAMALGCEYYEALDACHSFRTYGSLRPSCVETGEEIDDYPDDWVQIGTVAQVIIDAAAGDEKAQRLLDDYHAQRHPLKEGETLENTT